jgi:hypothetical protein
MSHTAEPGSRLILRASSGTALLPQFVAALLVLLLLAQPVVCVVHCWVAMQPVHHAAPNASDPRSFFLCDHPDPTAAHGLFTLAFWPGALPQLALFVVALLLLVTLLPRLPAYYTTLPPSPPAPPPR